MHARLLLLQARKQFDDIVTLLNEGTDRGNQRPDVLLSAALILASSPRHLDKAIELCERATEMAPGDISGYLQLGQLKYQNGDLDGAVRAYRMALEKDPSQSEALNNVAWILAEGRSSYDEALDYARKAVALKPDDAEFRDTLAFVLRGMGNLEGARDEYRQCRTFANRIGAAGPVAVSLGTSLLRARGAVAHPGIPEGSAGSGERRPGLQPRGAG